MVTPGAETADNDVGAEKTASLGDKVFLDAGRDGIQDDGEAAVDDVTVALTRVEPLEQVEAAAGRFRRLRGVVAAGTDDPVGAADIGGASLGNVALVDDRLSTSSRRRR